MPRIEGVCVELLDRDHGLPRARESQLVPARARRGAWRRIGDGPRGRARPERLRQPLRRVLLLAIVRVAHRRSDLGVTKPILELGD